METIQESLIRVLSELLTWLESREINRLEALEGGVIERLSSFEPALAETWKEIAAQRGPHEPGAAREACPEGLSPGAEILWRLCHLKRLGCPRGDLERLIAFSSQVLGIPWADLSRWVLGEEEVLRVPGA